MLEVLRTEGFSGDEILAFRTEKKSKKNKNWAQVVDEIVSLASSKDTTRAEWNSIALQHYPSASKKDLENVRARALKDLKGLGLEVTVKKGHYYLATSESVRVNELRSSLDNGKVSFKAYAKKNDVSEQWVIDQASEYGFTIGSGGVFTKR